MDLARMYDVIQEFVALKHSGAYSPEELIRKLSQSYPTKVKIEEWRNEDISLPFSAAVQFGIFNRFVEHDRTQISATRMAFIVACDWLMSAAKEYFPPQMNKDISQSNNIQKRSPSRANSVALLPLEPQKFPEDDKLNEILDSFKAQGHNVKIQNRRFQDTDTFELLYYSSFIVDGMEFNAQSKKSHSEAHLMAAKIALKNFAKSDGPQTKQFFNDNDNGFNLNGGNERYDSEKPVSNPKVDDKLSKLAQLVKNYNKGITNRTSPENSIQKLSEMNSFVISETTESFPNLFITTVDLIGIGSFFSSQVSQQRSESEASSKAMAFVQNLNSLLIAFEKASSNHLCSPSLEIMENLMMNDVVKWCTSIVRNDKSTRPRYHSTLLLTNMSSFDRIADTEMDAKKAVAEDGVNFLFKLAQTINSN